MATSNTVPGSMAGSGNQQSDTVDPYGNWGLGTAATATQLATARQAVLYLDSYTGTDDQKMTSALTAVFAASPAGGTIIMGARAHTFASQWTTTYSAGVATALKIQGAGAAYNGLWGTPTAATTATFTYSGAGTAMCDFQHIGTIEITGFQFKQANTGKPFIQTTNATPQIHDNIFSGGGTGATCVTDAILLGGTGSTIGGGDTAIFQGYGGWIRGNFFDGIRVCARLQAAANGIMISNNSISTSCGNAANYGSPFVLAGTSSFGISGTQIYGNLVEMVHYQCCVYAASYAVQNAIGPNSLFDNNAVTQYAAADATSNHNSVNDLSFSGSVPVNPPYDPTFTTTNVSQNTASRFPRGAFIDGNAVSGIGSAFWGVSNFGGQAGFAASGPNVSGNPTAAQINTNNPTAVSDLATINGCPYITSATAAFALSDVGFPGATLNAGVPGGGRIAWTYKPTSFGIAWTASTAVALGAPGLPTAQNGHLYQATTAGTAGSSQPTWPTGGGTVTDGSVVWQDLGTSVTMAQMSVNATATSTANPFFWGRSTGNLQMTSFKNHHVLGSGGTPTWTATGAGTGYTATAAGNDLGQILTLTTGTSSTAGIVATGSSAAILYGISGALSVTAGNAAAALLMAAAAGAPYILKNGTSGWILTIPGTPADSTAYKFHILTLG